MRRVVMVAVPNLLSAGRLIAGPLYLALGEIPVPAVQLAVLVAAGATDLIDGRIARSWGVTSRVGRFLDPLADRLLIACVLLKLAVGGVLPWWAIWIVFFQYATLSTVFLVYTFRLGSPPAPDFWARLGAGIAAMAGVVGLTTTSETYTLALVVLFGIANEFYLVAVGGRITVNARNASRSQR